MAMAGMIWGASLEAVRIAVGPSAPPMTPIAPASAVVKPRARASRKAVKIPSWAAAPSSRETGLASRGPKSVIAPMPIKIMDG